ncbi:YadA-like family protein [Brevundimonas sp.]|uniref:YadA-like family protein n=1 Tax=Brevundimonas sp. TaxID=1871086 RepID=UPI003BAC9707
MRNIRRNPIPACALRSALGRVVGNVLAAILALLPLLSPSATAAQSIPVVSACSGVSLPRSVVTDIMKPVITGIASPIESSVNSILGVVKIIPLVGAVFPNLALNATSLLTSAANGDPITLNVLDLDGEIVAPEDGCVNQADGFTLAEEAGIAIGGNQITGLGTGGDIAVAGEFNSIAFGNGATTAGTAADAIALGRDSRILPGAIGSVALGADATVSVANSLALGADSSAVRGAQANYAAMGLDTLQSSAGEVAFGAAGLERQLTHVAAGAAPTDAVNVGQLTGVADDLADLADLAVIYNDPTAASLSLSGVTGTVIDNLAAGALSATSTEAVNGAQLFATNTQVTTNTDAIADISTDLGDLSDTAVQYDDLLAGRVTLAGVTGTVIDNLAAGQLSATSTEAVNGSQLFATNTQVTTNTDAIADISTDLGDLSDTAVQYDDLLAGRVTLAGVTGTVIDNLAAGQLSATSTEAVNGSQLFATNTQVTTNTDAIADISTDLGDLSDTAVQYDDLLAGRVTLAGVTGTVIDNLAAGQLSATSTEAVNGSQLFATNTQVTTNTDAIADISTDLGDLSDTAVQYDDLLAGRVTLAGVTGTVIGNLAAGELSATSTEAVNGSQLFATNTQVTTNTDAIADISTDLGDLSDTAVQYDDLLAGRVTLAGVTGTVIDNLAAGELSATSTEAVNGAQLFATNAQVTTNTDAIADISTDLGDLSDTAVQYDDLLAGRVTLAGVTGTVIDNLAAGELSATSTEAVNGSQLFATNTQVTTNTDAIADISTDLGDLSDTAVQYDDLLAGRVTLAGVTGTVIDNLAAGELSATSTEAVNGSQLFATNTQVTTNTDAIADIAATSALAVTYDDATSATLTLQGVGGTVIANVADGELSATSNEAVNGSQLFATNAQVTTNSGDIVTNTTAITNITNDLNSGGIGVVQYSDAATPNTPNGGVPTNDLVLVGALNGPVVLHNLASGLVGAASTDAVNGGQMFDLGTGVAEAFGPDAVYDAATGAVTADLTYQGVSYDSVQAALNAVSGAAGGGAAYLAVNSAGAPASAVGLDGVAIGPDAQADAANSVAIGAGALANRAPQAAYVALGLSAPQSSVGSVSFGSAGQERQLTNVAAGSAATDAVNVGQLQGVSDRVDAVADRAVLYDDTSGAVLTLAGTNGTTVTNLANGQLSATSTDAVNGAQLFATNTNVAANTAAIADLADNVANGSLGPVRYSDPAAPEVPNGGTRTDDLTLVGVSGGAVGLHNVADGRIAAGSTDAVNGGQVYALASASVNAIQYDTNAAGDRTNTVTLQGGDASAPVTLNNVANGAVTATSTQAINGSQLFDTNRAVVTAQSTADEALTLGQNSIQYSSADRSRVVLGRAGGPAVTVSNLAAGVEAGDAVNVQQLREGLAGAVQQANAYTDVRLAVMNYSLREVRKLAYAGTAGALAAAGMPLISERGQSMMSLGVGTYEGESAMAVGFSRALGDGSMVFRAGATFDTQDHIGGNAGVGWRF